MCALPLLPRGQGQLTVTHQVGPRPALELRSPDSAQGSLVKGALSEVVTEAGDWHPTALWVPPGLCRLGPARQTSEQRLQVPSPQTSQATLF